MKEVKWVVAVFGVVLMLCGSAFGAAPNVPSSPDPSDGAVGVTPTVRLSWTCSDDDADHLLYEIWIRRVPANWPYSLDLLDMFKVPTIAPIEDPDDPEEDPGYTLANLMSDTTYVWRVRAIEDKENPEMTWGPRWTFTTDNSMGITAIAADPARAGRMIIIHGYGFLSGTPQYVAVGKKKFYYRESDRIIKWNDDEIWFTLPPFGGWEAGTVKERRIRVKVMREDGPVTANYMLEIYKKFYPTP